MMTDQQIMNLIRSTIQSEIQKANSQSVFTMQPTQQHTHSGTAGDAPKIPAANVIPGLRASGRITMATEGRVYRIGLNFNASQIQFFGAAYYPAGGTLEVRAQVIGNAQLGPCYDLLDDGTTFGVTTGGPIKSIIQGGSAFLVDETDVTQSTVWINQNNIVEVVYPNSSTIVAQVNVVSYGPGFAELKLTQLSANWEVDGYFVVT